MLFSFIRFMFVLLSYMFCFLLCVFRVFVLFCVLFLPMYTLVVGYFLFVYNYTDHSHWVETQKQLINFVSYDIMSYNIPHHK